MKVLDFGLAKAFQAEALRQGAIGERCDPDLANARQARVGRFDVDCDEVVHGCTSVWVHNTGAPGNKYGRASQ